PQAEMGYYAERTPDLPQTVRFLVDVIKNSQQDDALGEYAIAQAFEASRASPVHEERARSIAADLADNVTPQLVRNFRSALLKLRNEGLAAKLYERKDRVFARILPGYEANGRDPESRSFVI